LANKTICYSDICWLQLRGPAGPGHRLGRAGRRRQQQQSRPAANSAAPVNPALTISRPRNATQRNPSLWWIIRQPPHDCHRVASRRARGRAVEENNTTGTAYTRLPRRRFPTHSRPSVVANLFFPPTPPTSPTKDGGFRRGETALLKPRRPRSHPTDSSGARAAAAADAARARLPFLYNQIIQPTH
jgi:hypothetical protein